MKLINLNKDVYAGSVIALAGIFFFSETNKMNPDSVLFPKIVIAAFIILALAMVIEGVRKSKKNAFENKEKQIMTLAQIKIPLIIFLFITAYVIGLKLVGFYISTLIFIPAIILFYKNKNIVVILFSTIGTVVFLHFLIVVELKLMLP